jgi:S-(hydroxymethyl)glutathione dehydrogenase/alcohol dehydrogenase
MVLNELPIKPESSVVVLGLGGIGLSALLASKALGIRQLIAVDVAEEKLEIAREWGVKHAFHAQGENLIEKIQRLTGGGADFCIESAGQLETIEIGFSLIRQGGGKLLFASHPPVGGRIRLNPHELISGKQIAGSWGGATRPDRDIPRMHELFSKANLPLNSLVTKRYPLEQINEALGDLEAGRVFRPLIEMVHPE